MSCRSVLHMSKLYRLFHVFTRTSLRKLLSMTLVVVQIDIANHWSSPCDHDASSDHKYQTFYHCTWVSSEKLIFVSKSTTMIFIIPLTISTSAKRMMVIKRWESKTVGLISSHQLNVGKYSDGTQGENVLKDGNLSTTVEMNVKAM